MFARLHLVFALQKYNEIGLKIITNHPAYSPDLAPLNYYQFSRLKQVLNG
jgi:hypothetical protein